MQNIPCIFEASDENDTEVACEWIFRQYIPHWFWEYAAYLNYVCIWDQIWKQFSIMYNVCVSHCDVPLIHNVNFTHYLIRWSAIRDYGVSHSIPATWNMRSPHRATKIMLCVVCSISYRNIPNETQWLCKHTCNRTCRSEPQQQLLLVEHENYTILLYMYSTTMHAQNIPDNTSQCLRAVECQCTLTIEYCW